MGGDALAVRVCEELLVTQGHRVALLWMHSDEIGDTLSRLGCDYVARPPNDYDALRIAGVLEAASIMTLSDDDRLNLQVALKARDLNPSIRVVLRQFNRALGRKVEQNLPNCSVLSLASHSAAAFVGTALDPSCFHALQFPDVDGVQTGFAQRTAAAFDIGGLTVAAAQLRLRGRVIALNGVPEIPPEHVFAPEDEVIVFAGIQQLEATSPLRPERVERRRNHLLRVRVGASRRLRGLRRIDPILSRILIAVVSIYALAITYFSIKLERDPLTAFFFIATNFSITGEARTPLAAGRIPMALASFMVYAGLATSGIFIAFATSALTRAQFTAMQGLRRIRTRGHVLVCGSGNVGTRAVDYLRLLHHKVSSWTPAPIRRWSRCRVPGASSCSPATRPAMQRWICATSRTSGPSSR